MGGGLGQHVVLLAVFCGDDLFGGTGLAVLKGCLHRTLMALGIPLLIQLMAKSAHEASEISFEPAVGGGDSQVFILD